MSRRGPSTASQVAAGSDTSRGRLPGERLLVQVVDYYPPHVGGMEVVAKRLADGLAESHPVQVITSAPGASRGRRRGSGNQVVRRLTTFEFAHTPFMPTLPLHLLRLPRQAIVHVHVANAFVPEMVWLSSRMRRRPYIAHFHLDSDPTGRLGRLFVAYKRWILPRVLRSAAAVIVLTDEQADFLATRYRVERQRLNVLPNGVGPEFFLPARTSPSTGGPFRLLYVGRLSAQKNVARLLRTIAAVQAPVELVIVGVGQEQAALEQLAAELNLQNVRMVGSQMGEQLLDWYRWADAFILTSDKEGMPLVLLEAMAAGLPIVATDVPGIAGTVGADGLLAAPEPVALAAAVDRLATDQDLWRHLANRSSERSLRHAWPELIRQLDELYRRVVR